VPVCGVTVSHCPTGGFCVIVTPIAVTLVVEMMGSENVDVPDVALTLIGLMLEVRIVLPPPAVSTPTFTTTESPAVVVFVIVNVPVHGLVAEPCEQLSAMRVTVTVAGVVDPLLLIVYHGACGAPTVKLTGVPVLATLMVIC
jgi:hypothetical protein